MTCASSQVIRLRTHPPLQAKRHAATGSDINTIVMPSHGASGRAVDSTFQWDEISWSLHANSCTVVQGLGSSTLEYCLSWFVSVWSLRGASKVRISQVLIFWEYPDYFCSVSTNGIQRVEMR